MYYGVCNYSDIGTLKVITAREHVVFSGAVTSHSKSVRRHRQRRGHASHARYTVQSPTLKGEIRISASLSRNGARTRAISVTGTHSTSYATEPSTSSWVSIFLLNLGLGTVLLHLFWSQGPTYPNTTEEADAVTMQSCDTSLGMHRDKLGKQANIIPLCTDANCGDATG